MRRERVPFFLLGLPLVALGLRMLARLGGSFAAAGDLALIELSVDNAARGRQLLGAYSRFGWDQIGPAWFYLAAPFYRLAGSDTRGLFLATLALNALAALAVVAVVHHRAGRAAAAWTAGGLALWFVVIGPRVMISPWNPHAVTVPLLLVVVLSASAMTGSGWSLVGAMAVASVVLQGHLGTAPVVATVLLLGGAGWACHRWRAVSAGRGERRPWTRRRVVAVAGTVVGFGLLWGPTAVEEVTRTPGNVTAVTRFFREGFPGEPRRHALSDAAATVARSASAVGAGRDHRGEPGGASTGRQVVAGAWALAAGACAGVAWRRRRHFAAACGAVTLAAGVASVVGASRVVGALVPYVVFFATILPVGVIAGWGALGRPAPPTRDRLRGFPSCLPGVVLAAGMALVATWAALRTPLESEPPSPPAQAVVRLADDALRAAGEEVVVVRETDHSHWPVAVGLVLGLEHAGHDVVVEPNLVPLVGEDWAPGDEPRAELILGALDETAPAPLHRGGPPARTVGDAAGYRVWFRPGH